MFIVFLDTLMSIYLLSRGILALTIFLLFHAFINNGNLFKNGVVECDKICKHYGMKKTLFFSFFRVMNTRCSYRCEKTLFERIQNNS